jgi:hypothetical protein
VEVASPTLYGRFPERLHARILEAVSTEGVTVSKWLRQAALERLEGAQAAESERVALVAEARKFLANHRDGGYELSIVERLAGFLELVDGRISRAEQHGRARALAEVAEGALEPVDGEVVSLGPYGVGDERDLPAVLETAVPTRKRGFLRQALARERAHALLQAPPEPGPRPSSAGLLGEQCVRELWSEAVSWPGRRRAFCVVHGVVPTRPGDPDRCYLGCRLDTSDDGPGVA